MGGIGVAVPLQALCHHARPAVAIGATQRVDGTELADLTVVLAGRRRHEQHLLQQALDSRLHATLGEAFPFASLRCARFTGTLLLAALAVALAGCSGDEADDTI